MRKQLNRRGAIAVSALMLLTCTAGMMPARSTAPAVLTASAAEADYDWNGFLKKSADWFGSSEAVKIADECIQYQVANEGGWQKGMLTSHDGDWAHSTIDNDATTSQIRFLMRTYVQTGQQKYYDCAMRGVDCLFKMQYSNGGYMQCLNTPGTYHAHITLNDGAYVHVMQIMKEMSTKSGDFTKISDQYAQKAAASLEKAVQCLLNMQIKVNGELTAWCQQHDENTLVPAKARAYELPSVCTSESAGVVTFLYQYAKDTGRADVIRAVNAAIKWFQKVQINGSKWTTQGDDKALVQDSSASALWARFYDLDRMIPLFSDRDSSVHYNVQEISKERRTGYAWYGNWGKNVVGPALLDESGTPSEPEKEPELSGELIAKLTVHEQIAGMDWGIDDELKVGDAVFGDRSFTYVTLPDELIGAEYIRTACDSKNASGDCATLEAAENVIVYVLVDSRLSMEQGITPYWLRDWTQTGLVANTDNTVTFEIFKKELAAGESVKLGSNVTGQKVVNYAAAVVPNVKAVTTTTTELTTTTETTTTTSEITTSLPPVTDPPQGSDTSVPQKKMTGDVDISGDVTVADAVMLARYLAEDKDVKVSAEGIINAETNGIPGLTADDNAQLMMYLAHIITEFPADAAAN